MKALNARLQASTHTLKHSVLCLCCVCTFDRHVGKARSSIQGLSLCSDRKQHLTVTTHKHISSWSKLTGECHIVSTHNPKHYYYYFWYISKSFCYHSVLKWISHKPIFALWSNVDSLWGKGRCAFRIQSRRAFIFKETQTLTEVSDWTCIWSIYLPARPRARWTHPLSLLLHIKTATLNFSLIIQLLRVKTFLHGE